MEIFFKIVSLLGGLAMFLYGMHIMGDGLKSTSGGAMKAALARVTDKPFKGFLLGLVVTCMIQSSTAAIVLTVGLVGAGFLTFRQSIGIVLGANVGTTITAQIIRLMDVKAGSTSILSFFKSDNLAPMALIAGIILIMFVNSRAANTAGTILMGFGTLFVGLMNMSAAVSHMGDMLSKLLVSFEGSPLLGFFSGVFVTGIIQSSSAVVGILQSIASTIGIKFCGVFAVIIGIDIGDCLTTYLVCRIGAKPEQIRTALVHILYNVTAAILLFVAVGVLRGAGVLDDHIWYMTLKAGGVANVHGLFKLIPALMLLPCAGVFAKIAERLVPDQPEDPEDTMIKESIKQLDLRLINNPRIALGETHTMTSNMFEVALHNYTACIQQMYEYDPKRNDRMNQREDMIDKMTDVADKYVIEISPHITLDYDDRFQSFLMKGLVSIERIGDLAINIMDAIKSMKEDDVEFSRVAMAEMRLLLTAINDILELTADAYKESSYEKAKRIEPLEEVIDELVDEVRRRHMWRMKHNLCDVVKGLSFQNILQNLERISDQCSDLGVNILGIEDDNIYGNEHQYLRDIHHSDDETYNQLFAKYKAKYMGVLDSMSADSTDHDDADIKKQLQLDIVM